VASGSTAEQYLREAGALPGEALVITDPPRSGLSAELRGRLARWRPERIVMLACDPATWSRDTRDLIDRGYRLTHLELVDLFPSTHHVEILAVLERG
jgi:tRNA/tmRNA/rRNA uracil-C5-methylase (TrmA/RlmC/RlmD family)